MSRTGTRAAALALALIAPDVRAQVPLFGHVTGDCQVLALADPAASRPMSFGFHWAGPGRAGDPDVLFSARWWGSPSGQGPATAGSRIDAPGAWSFHSNWRLAQVPASQHDIVVVDGDGIWIDSITGLASFDGGVVHHQVVGVAGGTAPDVIALADRHAIRWRPLLEVSDVPPAEICSLAGRGPRGFLVGYAVWSLSRDAFPSPVRADFLRHGVPHLADLATLDFEVPDPDGASGSDLDAGDGLVLVNPDGLPDTGDEMLELHVRPAGGQARWYAVQPLVKGQFDFFDGGHVSVDDLPSVLADVTGDGVPDVADLLADGKPEFSSSCLGLGLLWEGDIVTSPDFGLGVALPGAAFPPPPRCDRGLRAGADTPRAVYEPSATDRRNVEPLAVRRDAASHSLVLGWEETLGGEYVVYLGPLETLLRDRRYELWPVVPCDPIRAPSLTIVTPPGDVIFLVTQVEGGRESSYGRDSFGRERPPAHPCP